MFAQLLANQEMANAKSSLHETAIKNLEVQMGQLASQMNLLTRQSLPSDTVPNPKREGNEACNAVTLRSGKQLEDKPTSSDRPQNTKEVITDVEEPEEPQAEIRGEEDDNKKRKQTEENLDDVVGGKIMTSENGEKKKRKTCASPPRPVLPPPFPQRLKKVQEDQQFKKFIDMFKQLHVNIPFAEALEQMPKYAKFMKEVLTNKRRFNEFETVAVTKSFTNVIKQLPPKLKDPRSFSIPCHIGNKFMGKGLCDSGASVNLMPLSIFNTLGLGEARPTTVTLQLADRSISYPRGIIEDVLVKVDKFIFPADFIVLDFEADKDMPMLLGRPFLAAARTLIDVEQGELTLRVADEEVTFNMSQLMRTPILQG